MLGEGGVESTLGPPEIRWGCFWRAGVKSKDISAPQNKIATALPRRPFATSNRLDQGRALHRKIFRTGSNTTPFRFRVVGPSLVDGPQGQRVTQPGPPTSGDPTTERLSI